MIRKVVREPTYKDWDDRRGLNWIDGKAYGIAEDGRTIQVKEEEDGNNNKGTN